jgi:hypothetical protein
VHRLLLTSVSNGLRSWPNSDSQEYLLSMVLHGRLLTGVSRASKIRFSCAQRAIRVAYAEMHPKLRWRSALDIIYPSRKRAMLPSSRETTEARQHHAMERVKHKDSTCQHECCL